MRRTSLALLAGAVAVTGLATVVTPTSVAAPGDAAGHVGDVLPGALNDWGGISGWVSANSAAIQAQAGNPAAVADTSGGSCLTTKASTGSIAVNKTCAAGTNVGFAVGDATGQLKVALGGTVAGTQTGATLTIKDPKTALFTADQAMGLIPVIHMTVQPDLVANPSDLPALYLIDLKAKTVTRDKADPTAPINFSKDPTTCPGTVPKGQTCFRGPDPIIDQYQACIVAQVHDGIMGTHDTDKDCVPEVADGVNYGDPSAKPKPLTGPTMLDMLNSGVVNALRDQVRWSTSFSQALPFSFAYPFGGSLTNGQTATVKVANILSGTWLGQMTTTGGAVSSVSSPVDVSTVTLANLLPSNTPGNTYSGKANLSASLWTALSPAIASQLDSADANTGVWQRTATTVAQGMSDGLAKMNNTKPLSYINKGYSNAVTFPALSTTDVAAIRSGLMKLTSAKVTEWHPYLQLSGPVTLTYQPGQITNLTPTGITTGSVVTNSSTPTSPTPTTATPPSTPPATTAVADGVQLQRTDWPAPDTRNSLTVQVTSNAQWKASSDAKWLRVARKAGRSGGTFRATAITNKGQERVGHITVVSGQASAVLTVTQQGRVTLTASPTSWKTGPDGGSQTFTITSTGNAEWSIQAMKPTASWIAPVKEGDQLKVTLEPNTGRQRTGNVVVVAGTRTFTIRIVQTRGQ